MGKYNFDEVIDRHGTDCLKYDFAKRRGKPADVLPLWVADMDFKTSSYVEDALIERAKHGIFGYSDTQEVYFNAVAGWMERHHHWKIKEDWLIKTPGVVFALAMAVKAFTKAGDSILIQQPVYYPFSEVIRDNDRVIVSNDLILGDDTRYHIDLADFEKQIVEHDVKLFLLCNPHNPAGRVWTPEELRRIGEICLRNDVFVVADEIHCELIMPGFRHTPFASLSDEFARRSVTCTSPSKAFNLAGLQVANIFAADAAIRERIGQALALNETGEISPFAIEALTAAYDEGAEWLDALNAYLHENYLFLRDFLARELPQYPVLPLEGTYLAWIDCRAAGMTSEALAERLLADGRLFVNPGSIYGAAGEGFIRLNIACPRTLLADGLERLKKALTLR